MYFYNVRYTKVTPSKLNPGTFLKSLDMMQFNARNQTSEQRMFAAIAYANDLITKGSVENVQVFRVLPGTSLESPISF